MSPATTKNISTSPVKEIGILLFKPINIFIYRPLFKPIIIPESFKNNCTDVFFVNHDNYL